MDKREKHVGNMNHVNMCNSTIDHGEPGSEEQISKYIHLTSCPLWDPRLNENSRSFTVTLSDSVKWELILMYSVTIYLSLFVNVSNNSKAILWYFMTFHFTTVFWSWRRSRMHVQVDTSCAVNDFIFKYNPGLISGRVFVKNLRKLKYLPPNSCLLHQVSACWYCLSLPWLLSILIARSAVVCLVVPGVGLCVRLCVRP